METRSCRSRYSLAGNGSATRCPGGTPPCQTATSGEVTFLTFEDGVRAAGTYTIAFDGGSPEAGSFDATWCAGPPGCG